MARRPFGNVRTLTSGRYQARYTGPDGRQHSGPSTFPTTADARLFLSDQEVRIRNHQWTNPAASRITLSEFSTEWLATKTNIAATTRELYEGFLTRHILPSLGALQLQSLSSTQVRKWRSDLSKSPLHRNTVAKIYRLLRQILGTAVDDDLLAKNPCRIKGGGQERIAERSMLEHRSVALLLEVVDERNKALLAVAAYVGLRFGEVAGLQRRHVNPLKQTITVKQQLSIINGEKVLRPPKTTAGNRTVRMPDTVAELINAHLAAFTNPDPEAFVFTSTNGTALDRANFRKRVWLPACRQVGIEDVTFHDLRHFAATLAASSGVPLKALMTRIGHSTAEAALIYQHAVSTDDDQIVDHIDKVLSL